jgi:hypothetical protein
MVNLKLGRLLETKNTFITSSLQIYTSLNASNLPNYLLEELIALFIKTFPKIESIYLH